jgi:membrane fusion protein, heavy metal efflux system
MKRHLLLLLTLLVASAATQAENIDLAALGDLELKYSAVVSADSYTGPKLAAGVSFRQGEGVSLVTPYRVQQITYQVAPGETVVQGQEIAVLRGPEIHHFITEFRVTEERLKVAQKRYDSNQQLYRKRAIDEGRWIEISDAFHALQLQYEHLRHFRELLRERQGDPDSVTLVSPGAGILQYHQDTPGIASGEELALLIPRAALRLRVAVPVRQRSGLAALEYDNCSLPVDSISGIARDFFVTAWSAALDERCPLLPGERLLVTPRYQFTGFRVPRESIFQWQGKPTVLVRRGQALQTVAVELVSSDAQSYTVTCAADIAGTRVLSTSVSAAQGVLLGLGGE